MKSQTNTMLRIWKAASLDAALSCALPLTEMERDNLSVERIALMRGEGFFTLDLPTLDDHLLFILEHGFSRFSGPLTGRKSKQDLRPKFLFGYWRLIIDERGMLKEDASPDAILAIRQLTKGLSKILVTCTEPRMAKAVAEFKDIENDIKVINPTWDNDTFEAASNRSFNHIASLPNFLQLDSFGRRAKELCDVLRRLDRVGGILTSGLGSFDSMSNDSAESGFFKHGPGAVANLSGSKYKYLFPFWSAKLEGIFPFDWCSGSPLGSYPQSNEEWPARLLAVPKTAKGPRLIAAEPVEHQWCQQKIASWLAYGFKTSRIGKFIALHDQSLSQRLVASASLDRSLSTIDLSSASDRIATWHIETLFAANPGVVEAFHAVRTRKMKDEVTNSGVTTLKKFSTMGSALTFPVQSLFFLSIALAACGCSTPKEIDALEGQVRVFGDDIIVPSTAYEIVIDTLHLLGLKANVKKSFSLGHFRESCGADYWNGYNVTPVKPKTITPDTATDIQGILDSSNNFHARGYWRTAQALARLLPKPIREGLILEVSRLDYLLVNGKQKYDVSAVPALQSFSGRKTTRERWNSDLHMTEYRLIMPRGISEKATQDHSASLREFFTKPWREFFPRTTGVARNRAANLAVRWVGLPKKTSQAA